MMIDQLKGGGLGGSGRWGGFDAGFTFFILSPEPFRRWR
jgi:hypothetical protein